MTSAALTMRARVAARVKGWLDAWGGAEGTWRGPFFGQAPSGRWFELGNLEDGFQRDLAIGRYGMQAIPVVAAVRQLHRSAFAQLRPGHIRTDQGGDIEHVTASAAYRAMTSPNTYETGADFNARLIDCWLCDGEVKVWALRNGRGEVDSLHILPGGSAQLAIDPESKAIFYAVNSSGALLETVADATIAVPARDILHLRWATPRHPLIGESAFAAAGLAAGINVALSRSQAAFFTQMRRPSGVLVTDQLLNQTQIETLRAAFDKQSALINQGGIPILMGGLKWAPMGISSEDAQVIDALRMSNEEIARCVGVPPPLVGELQAGALTSTETLIAFWLSISLGGLIERYERGLDRLFGFDGVSDTVDLDVSALLRTNLQARMEALTKGVQGGILTPNEARKSEGLTPIEGGDGAFMQRQNTPIDLLDQLAAAELKNATAPPPPAPAPAPALPAPAANDDQAAIDATASKAMALANQAVELVSGQFAKLEVRIDERLARHEQRTTPVAIANDGATAEMVFADDGRIAFPLLRGEKGTPGENGLQGEPGECGADGAAGRDGADAPAVDLAELAHHVARAVCVEPTLLEALELLAAEPAWTAGVYREGVRVSHFLGRTYVALRDTTAEPGDAPADWRRLGTGGERHCGTFDTARAYEVGDRYVKDRGTFLVIDAAGTAKCLVPRSASEGDLRQVTGALEALRGELSGLGLPARLAKLDADAGTAETLLRAIVETVDTLSGRVAALEAG